MYKTLMPCLLVLSYFSTPVLADVSYDSDFNLVEINTELLSKSDTGYISIDNEKTVTLMVYGFRDGGVSYLCGASPSLGAILLLDGQSKLGVSTPKVSGTVPFGKRDIKLVDAGYVHAYEFKDDAALDFLDLLYEYDEVGFAISNDKCTGREKTVFTVNFKTRGLDRAMQRLKD